MTITLKAQVEKLKVMVTVEGDWKHWDILAIQPMRKALRQDYETDYNFERLEEALRNNKQFIADVEMAFADAYAAEGDRQYDAMRERGWK